MEAPSPWGLPNVEVLVFQHKNAILELDADADEFVHHQHDNGAKDIMPPSRPQLGLKACTEISEVPGSCGG